MGLDRTVGLHTTFLLMLCVGLLAAVDRASRPRQNQQQRGQGVGFAKYRRDNKQDQAGHLTELVIVSDMRAMRLAGMAG